MFSSCAIILKLMWCVLMTGWFIILKCTLLLLLSLCVRLQQHELLFGKFPMISISSPSLPTSLFLFIPLRLNIHFLFISCTSPSDPSSLALCGTTLSLTVIIDSKPTLLCIVNMELFSFNSNVNCNFGFQPVNANYMCKRSWMCTDLSLSLCIVRMVRKSNMLPWYRPNGHEQKSVRVYIVRKHAWWLTLHLNVVRYSM